MYKIPKCFLSIFSIITPHFFSHLNRYGLAYYYGFNLYFFKDGLFKLSTLTYVIRYENIFVGPSLGTNVLSIISSSNIYYHMLLMVFHVEDEYIRSPPWAARDRYQILWAADTVPIIDSHALRGRKTTALRVTLHSRMTRAPTQCKIIL